MALQHLEMAALKVPTATSGQPISSPDDRDTAVCVGGFGGIVIP
jgi:hypothetical protein